MDYKTTKPTLPNTEEEYIVFQCWLNNYNRTVPYIRPLRLTKEEFDNLSIEFECTRHTPTGELCDSARTVYLRDLVGGFVRRSRCGNTLPREQEDPKKKTNKEK